MEVKPELFYSIFFGGLYNYLLANDFLGIIRAFSEMRAIIGTPPIGFSKEFCYAEKEHLQEIIKIMSKNNKDNQFDDFLTDLKIMLGIMHDSLKGN